MGTTEFQPFPKIPRLLKDIVITEKIDGTNAQVFISDDLSVVQAGSKNRVIVPGDDNFGFALWVQQNREELKKLGPGRHYGEWWGVGIQRGYGLHERRFSLFNTHRWRGPGVAPACCHVVPVLYTGAFDMGVIQARLKWLREDGSHAAPGYMDPEGIVVYHTAAGSLFKVPFDPAPKGN